MQGLERGSVVKSVLLLWGTQAHVLSPTSDSSQSPETPTTEDFTALASVGFCTQMLVNSHVDINFLKSDN